MKWTRALTAAVLLMLVQRAEGQAPDALQLSQAVDAALAYHPLVKASRLGMDQAGNRTTEVRAERAPSLTAEDQDAIPIFRSVLIPTDFSSLANRAIPVGYGLVAPGGIVHLLHVVTRKSGEDDLNVTDRLRALVPKGATEKGVVTEVEVLEEQDAWHGIWHSAGRRGVDAICMATHGRSGITEAVFGSQAREVLGRAHQPVILVPPERDR